MYQTIREICGGLVELYETKDPFELCDCLDVKIIETNLSNNILGFFQRIKEDYEIIYLNNNISNEKTKEYVCLHELGHVIVHPELSLCFLEDTFYIKNRFEKEADIFASEFMIPEHLEYWEVEGKTFEQIGAYLEVPEKLVRLRFEKKSLDMQCVDLEGESNETLQSIHNIIY